MRKKNFVSLPIKGTEWHFYLEKASVYKRNHGSDSAAITYTKEKEVYFDTSEFDTDTVKHELFHIYIAESNTNSSPDFTKDDMEEVACSIFGEYGELMVYQASYIHNKLLTKTSR